MAAHSNVLAWRIPGMGAWWAGVYGVAQSRTRLTRLSSSSRCLINVPCTDENRTKASYVQVELSLQYIFFIRMILWLEELTLIFNYSKLYS